MWVYMSQVFTSNTSTEWSATYGFNFEYIYIV